MNAPAAHRRVHPTNRPDVTSNRAPQAWCNPASSLVPGGGIRVADGSGMKHRIGLALVAGLFLGACVAEEDPDLDEVDQEVIGGADEPDYRYPWVVRVSSAESCGGVLIHPSWVLTARHCVSTFTTPSITFARTDA